jgi:hypothetical protein
MALASKEFGSIEPSCTDSDQDSSGLRLRTWVIRNKLKAYPLNGISQTLEYFRGIGLPEGGTGALGQTTARMVEDILVPENVGSNFKNIKIEDRVRR